MRAAKGGDRMKTKGTDNRLAGAQMADSRPTEPISAQTSHAQICDRAADHVARARQALNGDSLDPIEALSHLDDAISCLKSLSRRGLSRKEASPNGRTENSVLEFPPGHGRRSA